MKPTRSSSHAAQPSAAEPTNGGKGKRASRRPGRRVAARPNESLLEACTATPRLQSFLSVIDAAGLAGMLQGEGPLTIFAPTDRAFGKIPSEDLAALLNDKSRLIQVLRHHVVAGRVKAPRELEPRTVTPQFGASLRLTSAEGSYHVDDARIVKTNLRGSNGVIHAIDTVLLPQA